MNRLGFIGMGNMAEALAQGFISSGALQSTQISAYAPNQEKLHSKAARLGFVPEASLAALSASCDTLILACKPQQAPSVIAELGTDICGKAFISIALGWDYERCREALPEGVRIQFVMPNTPALVGEGVMLFEDANSLEAQERVELEQLFSSVGVVEHIPSSLMGIAGTITGCGPAFVDLMIEAFGDVAVKHGLTRKQSYALVSQMMKGAAALQLETGEHPATLKDQVCSPGGSTIRGVCALEEYGMRTACIHAVESALTRS